MTSTVTLKINQQTTLSLSPVDNSGNFAPITGIPTWVQTNSGIADLIPAPSGMSAVIVGKNVGLTVITARSNGASGMLSISTNINVVTNLATNMALTPGPVISKPAFSTAGSLGIHPAIAQQKINAYNRNPARALAPASKPLQHFKPAIHVAPKGTPVPPKKPTVRTKPLRNLPIKQKPEVKPEIKPEVKPAIMPPHQAPVLPVHPAPVPIPVPHVTQGQPNVQATPAETIKKAMGTVKRAGGCGCGGRR